MIAQVDAEIRGDLECEQDADPAGVDLGELLVRHAFVDEADIGASRPIGLEVAFVSGAQPGTTRLTTFRQGS